MGIDLYMIGLEDCPEARCYPQQRDIVGYDPYWGDRGEEETAAKVVRIERLDSPLFDPGSRLAELAEAIGPFDESHFAVVYDYELTPMHKDITGFLGPLWDRHARRLEVISRSEFEKRITLLRGETPEAKSGLISWWNRESRDNSLPLCESCPLKLPIDYRTDCHGYLSGYPRLPLLERTLVATMERMVRLDEGPDPLPDPLREGLARAGFNTYREALNHLSAFLPEVGPAVDKWKVEWIWKSFAGDLNEVISGCDLLEYESQRNRTDLVEHIMNCLVFKEPEIDSAIATRLLPFFEAAMPVMETVAVLDPESHSWLGWLEYRACLRNVVRFGVRIWVTT